jgi:hypothetical protein
MTLAAYTKGMPCAHGMRTLQALLHQRRRQTIVALVMQALQQKLAVRHCIKPWGGGQFKPALQPTVVGPFVPEETQSRDSRTVPDVSVDSSITHACGRRVAIMFNDAPAFAAPTQAIELMTGRWPATGGAAGAVAATRGRGGLRCGCGPHADAVAAAASAGGHAVHVRLCVWAAQQCWTRCVWLPYAARRSIIALAVCMHWLLSVP